MEKQENSGEHLHVEKHSTEDSFKDPYYDPNFNGGRMITHPLELAELEYLTEEAKKLNALEEDETKRFPPGYVRLTKKRHYDFSSESIKDNL